MAAVWLVNIPRAAYLPDHICKGTGSYFLKFSKKRQEALNVILSHQRLKPGLFHVSLHELGDMPYWYPSAPLYRDEVAWVRLKPRKDSPRARSTLIIFPVFGQWVVSVAIQTKVKCLAALLHIMLYTSFHSYMDRAISFEKIKIISIGFNDVNAT